VLSMTELCLGAHMPLQDCSTSTQHTTQSTPRVRGMEYMRCSPSGRLPGFMLLLLLPRPPDAIVSAWRRERAECGDRGPADARASDAELRRPMGMGEDGPSASACSLRCEHGAWWG
jgi:hypothetical protein